MNQKVLQTLEFDKIINILTGYATTELGKLMCANLKPMTEEADILNAQDQTQVPRQSLLKASEEISFPAMIL